MPYLQAVLKEGTGHAPPPLLLPFFVSPHKTYIPPQSSDYTPRYQSIPDPQSVQQPYPEAVDPTAHPPSSSQRAKQSAIAPTPCTAAKTSTAPTPTSSAPSDGQSPQTTISQRGSVGATYPSTGVPDYVLAVSLVVLGFLPPSLPLPLCRAHLDA